MVCQLVERIRSLRPPTAPKTGRLLLFRPRGRKMLVRRIRAALREVVSLVGIPARIVPHQFRHTYGTEMLRAGVGFAAVMKLLGHKSPDMTLQYLQITSYLTVALVLILAGAIGSAIPARRAIKVDPIVALRYQ